MHIDIQAIARDTGSSLDVRLQFDPKDIALDRMETGIAGPVLFEGVLKNVADRCFLLTGRICGNLDTVCDRCGESVRIRLSGDVEASFRCRSEGQEAEYTADPEEVYNYEGFAIVPDKAFRDSLILSLPIKCLCKEDCRGLCPVCGNDRNLRDCGCEQPGTKRKSAFDELKKLL